MNGSKPTKLENDLTAQETISAQLNRPPLSSKKYLVYALGLGCVMFVFVGALLSILLASHDKAGEIVTLSNLTISFIAGLSSLGIGGLSYVESCHSENIMKISSHSKDSEVEEKK